MANKADHAALVPAAAPEEAADVAQAHEQDLQRMMADQELANALSRSLLFSLSRQHLDLPLDEANYLAPLPSERTGMEDYAFLQLEQVGSPATVASDQPYVALQTALASCRDPGHYRLVFLVANDGAESHVYLGAWSRHRDHYPPEDLASVLGHALAGNWPGTRLGEVGPKDPGFQARVTATFKDLRYGVALTGIPSLKPGDHSGYPQSLDRLLHSLRGLPFTYLVIADPMADSAVNDVINRCLDLLGRVHLLTRSTLGETLANSIAQTVGREDSTSESHAHSVAETQSEVAATDSAARWLKAAGRAMPALLPIFPPAPFLGKFMIKFGSGLESPEGQPQRSRTETDTYTTASGSSISRSTGLTRSAAQTLGREYLDAHAEASEAQLRQYIARFEQARSLGCWNVGVYLLGKTPDIVHQCGMQLRALLSGEKSAFEPIRVHSLDSIWKQGTQKALLRFEQPPVAIGDPSGARTGKLQGIVHPLGPAFSGLTTPLTTEELALLVNLPQREVPGVPVATAPGFALNVTPRSGDSLALGNLLHGGEPLPLVYRVSLPMLARHTLVAGAPGSGKTTTCQHMLGELSRLGVPFLVIEPSRYEYLEWATRLNGSLAEDDARRVDIYMPGVESWRGHNLSGPLCLNPFEVPWLDTALPPQVLPHVYRLASILAASYPTLEFPPDLLEEILLSAYSSPHDWLGDAAPPLDTPYPTLDKLLDHISPIVSSKGHEQRVAVNVNSALTARLQSLRRGWMGRLFSQPRSTPWAVLFDRPAVVNLSRFGDDADRTFTTALLLQFLYEYRQAQRDSRAGVAAGVSVPLSHVTAVEEAHRILGRAGPGSAVQSNVQGRTAEMLTGLLSNLSACGEGVVAVDQAPAALAPAAIANTNLKIVHRLAVEDDRALMAGCLALTFEQAAFISRLRAGQVLVFGDLDEAAAWVQVSSSQTHPA